MLCRVNQKHVVLKDLSNLFETFADSREFVKVNGAVWKTCEKERHKLDMAYSWWAFVGTRATRQCNRTGNGAITSALLF